MTQEQKELLLKDLCSRLPYDVNVLDDMGRTYKLQLGNSYLIDLFYENGDYVEAPIRPYLRPMSSMTEEERDWYKTLLDGNIGESIIKSMDKVINRLIAHHFDFRGLIPMGLALEATKDMYQQLKTK